MVATGKKNMNLRVSEICELTRRVLGEWEEPYGWAPNSAAEKICKAMKPWIIELTECLHIWEEKAPELTDGELILAKANLGSLIESWLKFTHCVYYEDYLLDPRRRRDNSIIEPENMSFEDLKIYSRGKIWKQGDSWDKWVEKMQGHRNAIHSFNGRDIGESSEYCFDCIRFYDFILLIEGCLPDSPVEAMCYYFDYDD